MVFLFNGEPDVWDKLQDMINVHYYQMITTGNKMKLGIFVAVVAIALLIWLAVLEDRKWQAFKAEQNCKVVSHTRSTVNPGFGVMSNGQMGMITTTTPSKTGWLCDDGVIYYR